MVTRVSQRLAEAGTPVFYPQAEIVAALNEAQRFFVLLTLGLETTAAWNVPAATTYFHMLSYFSDWMVPLRITTSTGQKVRPARVEELTALDTNWQDSAGAPYRYAAAGADFLALYQQPPSTGTTLSVTYVQAPVALVNPADTPQIPAEYHPKLVAYGVYRPRQVEGGQEFAKTLPMLNEFLDGAQHYANYVRARNRGSQYDKTPFELEKFDRSTLLKLRKDLMPQRPAA